LARPPSPARRPDSVRTQERKLDRLAARVGDLEIQMRALIASAGRRGGRRGAKPRKRTLFKNSMTLTEALRKLLKGRTMRVVEAAQAVQKAGYRTISKSFQIQVGGILNNGAFKRVGVGRYTAK